MLIRYHLTKMEKKTSGKWNKAIMMMGRKLPPSENIFPRKSLSQTNISKGRRGKDFITFS